MAGLSALLFCLLAGKAEMADLPEPSAKPEKPPFCFVGRMTNPCAFSVNDVTWNKQIGYWFVTCTTPTTAAGNHRGWKWPEQENWTWCADYRRLGDSRIPPRVRRTQEDAAVVPGASLPEEPIASVKESAGSYETNAPSIQTKKKRRTLPESFKAASSKEGVSVPSAKTTFDFKSLTDFLDYNTLAAIEATNKSAPNFKKMFDFFEIPFTQGEFPWTFFAFGEPLKCTSTCVFVALLVAESFAFQPQDLKSTWKQIEFWRKIYEQAARLHSEYFHRIIQPAWEADGFSLPAPVLVETMRSSVLEFIDSLPMLGEPFKNIRRFARLGSPTGLLDKCGVCARVSCLEVKVCPCGKVCPRGTQGSLRQCIDRADEYARANPKSTIASLVTVAERTFFLGIHETNFVYSDSHHRSWNGEVKNASLVVYGSWSAKARTSEKLWPALSRGETRYSDAEPAAIVSWKIDSNSVTQECLPTGASVAAAGFQHLEEEPVVMSTQPPAASPQGKEEEPVVMSTQTPAASPQGIEEEPVVMSTKPPAASPQDKFTVGMTVRLKNLSRLDLNDVVGTVIEGSHAWSRGRIPVRLPSEIFPVAVKPENCEIVQVVSSVKDPVVVSFATNDKESAREDKAASVTAAQISLPSTPAVQQKAVSQHLAADSEDAEEADFDELEVLLRREENKDIVKVFPDAKNQSQLTICYACNTSQEHRSRKKAAYYLQNVHFIPNGNPRKFEQAKKPRCSPKRRPSR